METGITISTCCNVSGDEDDEYHCNGSGNNRGSYCCLYSDENDACFTAMEAGITISFAAMKAGITKVVTATYTVMKMTRVSMQWKRE